MIVYILRRLLLALSVVFATIVLTFSLFFSGAGGNPAYQQCTTHCTTSIVKALDHQMGLDKPIIDQFGTYVEGLVVGRDISSGGVSQRCSAPCLGWSFVQSQSVTTMVGQVLPVTISIVVGGAVVFIPLGLLLGVVAATRRGSPVDRFVVGVSQVVGAIPYYVWALVLNLYLVLIWGVLPAVQYNPITQGPWQWFTGFFSIWVIFGVFNALAYVRYVRAFMINTLSADYVRTARSKGVGEMRVIVSHALRAAIAPFLTLIGIDLAGQLSGSIFTEQVFNVLGMGKLSINSLTQSDLPVMAGTVLVGAVFIVLGNLIVDMMYAVVDPTVTLS